MLGSADAPARTGSIEAAELVFKTLRLRDRVFGMNNFGKIPQDWPKQVRKKFANRLGDDFVVEDVLSCVKTGDLVIKESISDAEARKRIEAATKRRSEREAQIHSARMRGAKQPNRLTEA